MGGFLLIRHSNLHLAHLKRVYRKALVAFSTKGLSIRKEFHSGSYWLLVYDFYHKKNDGCLTFDDNSSIVGCGTCFYKGLFGNQALQSIFEDYTRGHLLYQNIEGNFAILIRSNDRLVLFSDLFGNYRIFRDKDSNIYSSSFLSLESVLDTKTPSNQEIYEFIFTGAFYGGSTIFKEIELLDSHFVWSLMPEEKKIRRQAAMDHSLRNLPLEQAVPIVCENLIGYFQMLHHEFGDDIISALSGGYDSRLLLAAMRHVGISPILYVYGSSESSDVKIAHQIAQGEGLALECIDKSAYPRIQKDNFPAHVLTTFSALDGFSNEGIFNNGSDLQTRLQRTRHSPLQINGGGGEIYRNFWRLPNVTMTIDSFLKSKYDSVAYQVLTTNKFDKKRFFSVLARKIGTTLETESQFLTRKQIESLYPLFRLKYWMGINNSINNQLTYSLTPYSEPRFVYQSLAIPIKDKNYGNFEAALIHKLDPRLASYPSGSRYGRNFTEAIGSKAKFKENIIANMPTGLKPMMRRLKHRRDRRPLPYYLQNEYIETIFDMDNLAIADYVDLTRVNDPETVSRALTVELHLNG